MTSTTTHRMPLGGDDAFILAWGRQNAALAVYRWLLVALMVVCLALVVLVGYLVHRNEQKTVWCFVKDGLGNVVQADPDAFLRAGERRSEVDIKAFTSFHNSWSTCSPDSALSARPRTSEAWALWPFLLTSSVSPAPS